MHPMDKWVPGYNAYLDQNKTKQTTKKPQKKKKKPHKDKHTSKTKYQNNWNWNEHNTKTLQ